jgi:hypothetical protein
VKVLFVEGDHAFMAQRVVEVLGIQPGDLVQVMGVGLPDTHLEKGMSSGGNPGLGGIGVGKITVVGVAEIVGQLLDFAVAIVVDVAETRIVVHLADAHKDLRRA